MIFSRYQKDKCAFGFTQIDRKLSFSFKHLTRLWCTDVLVAFIMFLITVSIYSGSVELITLALQFRNPSDSYFVGICEPCMAESWYSHK